MRKPKYFAVIGMTRLCIGAIAGAEKAADAVRVQANPNRDYSARAFLGTTNLLRDQRFEVMGIAVKKSQ